MAEDSDNASQKATVLGDGAAVNIGSDRKADKPHVLHFVWLGIEIVSLAILILILLNQKAHGGL